MKSSSLLLALIAAVVGGVVGAFSFSVIQPSADPVPRPDDGSIGVTPNEPYNDTDLRVALKQSDDELAALRLELGALKTDLSLAKQAMVEENTKPAADDAKVEGTETEVESETPAESSDQPESELKAEVDTAVKDALAKAREEEREKEVAAKRNQTEKWVNNGRDRVLKTLDAELNLTVTQRENIARAFDSMNTRISELYEDATVAKENGEDFDWGTEWETLIEDTDAAIRAEIGTAQLHAYDELAGERGFSGIAWPSK